MEQEDNIRLTASFNYVCTNLQSLEVILGNLRSKRVIDGNNEEEIKAERVSYSRNKALVDCLLKKRGALSPFIAALNETGQSFIAEHIEQQQNQAANEYMEQNQAGSNRVPIDRSSISGVQNNSGIVAGAIHGNVSNQITHHHYPTAGASKYETSSEPNNTNSRQPMNQFDCAKLTKHQFVLVRDLDPLPVVDYLLSKEIFLAKHANDIRSKRNSAEMNREFLSILKTRGASALNRFIDALNETLQYDLATLLST